jgi:hypothetical protein
MKKRNRKKASVIIEYLVTLPAFVLLLWTISQVMLYTLASSTAHETAMEGARVLTMQTRGFDKDLNQLPNKNEVVQKLHDKMATVAQFNSFFMLYKNDEGTDLPKVIVTPANLVSDCTTKVCTIIEYQNNTDHLCKDYLEDPSKRRVICAYTALNEVNNKRDHQQIIVKVKSNFKIVGNFIPGIKDKTFIHASGISTKELAGRFQTYYDSGGTP